MNIFYLDEDPRKAARYLCNEHMKMLLESAQMLSTAVRVLIPNTDNNYIYKKTHENHPSSIWVRESKSNLTWTFRHAHEISKENVRRYGKQHKSMDVVNRCFDLIKSNVDILDLPEYSTRPRLAMPERYKNVGEREIEILMADGLPIEVACYRFFYCVEKRRFATWKYGKPEWYKRGITHISDLGNVL